ncbi:hypothetical protein A9K75_07900 [Campylobacter fetus subsp. testudinum]|uniref:hypothetical protein n=1 Tax=Campylobacter fetus TaxID=196 RepID=UPI000818C8E8|nr:hypothetical protein [Campylobacter fetus]OCR99240.1 hypothetical protein A9K75_07900 [Campylobacter fetus subsp. testudinum]
MAFYNPKPVTFNPSTGVIGAAGAFGDKLYDIYQNSIKNAREQEKLNEEKANNAWNKNFQTEKFGWEQNQADKKWEENQITRDINQANKVQEINDAKDKFNADQDWKNKNYNLSLANAKNDASYKKRVLDLQQQGLDLKKQEQQTKNLSEAGQILAQPSYFDQQGETKTIVDKLNTINNMGVKNFNQAYGVADGALEKIGGWVGKNANTESDDILRMMSDKIYRNNVRRDTAYNKEQHDSLFRQPVWYKSESANQANAIKVVNAYFNSESAEINDFYNKRLTQATAMKNPAIAAHLENSKRQDLAKLETQKQQLLGFYKESTTNSGDNTKWDIEQTQPQQNKYVDTDVYGIKFR